MSGWDNFGLGRGTSGGTRGSQNGTGGSCHDSGDAPGNNDPSFRDPWAAPMPPKWPPGIFGEPFDEMIQKRAVAAGLDRGAMGLATLGAISGAAPKNTLIAPYGQWSHWRQSPILWEMLIAESGNRKTALTLPFRALERVQDEVVEKYEEELRAWNVKKEGTAPAGPHVYIVSDPSAESLQDILVSTNRGTCLMRDELAGWLNGFARYNSNSNDREFYLNTYDGESFTVTRVKRGRLFIKVNGLTVCGFIQPDRLASFKDLHLDDFIQRINLYNMAAVTEAQDVGVIRGEREFDNRVAQLASLDGRRGPYEPTPVGIAIIRHMERDGLEMARYNNWGAGFSGFCRKLNGTLARVALLLHLFDNPDSDAFVPIPDSTVRRAETLVRDFILPATVAHYDAAAPEAQRTRDIASWLLTSAKPVFVASDLQANVRLCRTLSTREITDALDPLLTGGWLEPENLYPGNRRWTLDLRVRDVLRDRAVAEHARKARIYALWDSIRTGNDETVSTGAKMHQQSPDSPVAPE